MRLSLIALFAIAAILAAVAPAVAATPPWHVGTQALLPVLEEALEEEGESEEEELEAEEEEETYPPAECFLQTARAQAFAYPAQGKVRLSIHYTSTEPTEASVSYRLKGSKGSLRFPESRQHLAKSGQIRLSENLSKAAMSKALAAKGFKVELRIPEAPSYCRPFSVRHLTIEHTSASRTTWLQSDPIYGTGA